MRVNVVLCAVVIYPPVFLSHGTSPVEPPPMGVVRGYLSGIRSTFAALWRRFGTGEYAQFLHEGRGILRALLRIVG